MHCLFIPLTGNDLDDSGAKYVIVIQCLCMSLKSHSMPKSSKHLIGSLGILCRCQQAELSHHSSSEALRYV